MSRTELFDVYETDADGNNTTRFAYVTTRAQAEVLAEQLRTSRSTPAHVHVLPCAAPTREDGWRDLAPFLAALPALKSVEFATPTKLDGELNIFAASTEDFGSWMTALGLEMVVPGLHDSRTAHGMWRGWMVDLCAQEPRPGKRAAEQHGQGTSAVAACAARTNCTACGATNEDCLRWVQTNGSACCGTCCSTDTHGTEQAAREDREKRRTEVLDSLSERPGTEDAYIRRLPDLDPHTVVRGFRGHIIQFALQGDLVFWYDQDNSGGPRWAALDAVR